MMGGYVATIGMFDGVHCGHQFVLREVVQAAREHGLQSMAITFDHSPRQEQVLTPLAEKQLLLLQTGIDRVQVLPFTQQLKLMTARQFMQKVLRDKLGVKVLLTGYDNRFGHNREEGFDDYVRHGRELGIEVLQLPAKGQVSSSVIRQQLQDGRVEDAATLLGRPYAVTGAVTHGRHIGTGLGYPTANVVPAEVQQLIPANGVYAVRCDHRKGMMNIGTRPTFDGHQRTLEVHLFNYEGDLYGQMLTIDFVSRLREERSFDSPEALVEQLKKDALEAQKRL